MSIHVSADCPEPYPDCRPGACDCDGIYDRAKYRGEDPDAAVQAFIAHLADIEVVECEHCDGVGYRIEAGV